VNVPKSHIATHFMELSFAIYNLLDIHFKYQNCKQVFHSAVSILLHHEAKVLLSLFCL